MAFFNFSVLFLMENNEIHFCNPNKKAPKKNRNKTTKPKNNSHLSSSTDVHIPTVTNTKIHQKIVQPTAKHFSMRSIILSIDYLSFTFIACQYLIRSGLNPAQYSNSSSVSSSMILISGKL